jgi:acetyl-CoA carboxylase carboxyl transferase subunit alpha
MSTLKTPIICTVIGEGGSGGALAIGVGDQTLMLQYGTYSVISPEGCASILWKSAEKASEAAEALGITSGKLRDLGMVDRIIPEPLGGAHRDIDAVADNVKQALVETLGELQKMSADELIASRYKRLQAYGQFTGG